MMMPTIRTGLLTLVFLLFVSCEEDALAELSPLTDDGSFAPNAQMQQDMLVSINALRTQGCFCGSEWYPPAKELIWSYELEQSSYLHAIDMYRFDYFSHTSNDGRDIGDRVTATGYNYNMAAENIAWGFSNLEAVMKGWKDSPGHCVNMMNPELREIGASRVSTYWVQNFGRRWTTKN